MARRKKPAPKDKHSTKWWMKRDAVRKPLQEAHAAAVKQAEEAAALQETDLQGEVQATTEAV